MFSKKPRNEDPFQKLVKPWDTAEIPIIALRI
jgi:hypothetical protein